MPVPRSHWGVKGDECQCGRRASIRHCPSCGSSRIRAYSNPRYHKYDDGHVALVDKEFRCDACANLFVDEEREFCEAPPVGQKLASEKVRALHEASQTGEYLNPQERVAAEAIKEMLGPQPNATLTDIQLRNLHTSLKREWVDAKMRATQNGQKFTEECEDYVVRILKESGREPLIAEIQRVDALYKEMARRKEEQDGRNESSSTS